MGHSVRFYVSVIFVMYVFMLPWVLKDKGSSINNLYHWYYMQTFRCFNIIVLLSLTLI